MEEVEGREEGAEEVEEGEVEVDEEEELSSMW